VTADAWYSNTLRLVYVRILGCDCKAAAADPPSSGCGCCMTVIAVQQPRPLLERSGYLCFLPACPLQSGCADACTHCVLHSVCAPVLHSSSVSDFHRCTLWTAHGNSCLSPLRRCLLRMANKVLALMLVLLSIVRCCCPQCSTQLCSAHHSPRGLC
jgi:hypothetical protein